MINSKKSSSVEFGAVDVVNSDDDDGEEEEGDSDNDDNDGEIPDDCK